MQSEKKIKTTVLTAALLLSGIPAEVINRSMDTYNCLIIGALRYHDACRTQQEKLTKNNFYITVSLKEEYWFTPSCNSFTFWICKTT